MVIAFFLLHLTAANYAHQLPARSSSPAATLSNCGYRVQSTSFQKKLGAAAVALLVQPVMARALTPPLSPVVNRATALQDVAAAAEFIKLNCPTVLRAAERTGRCLYRGETLDNLDSAKPWLLGFPGDLLDPTTYSPIAADYFSALDKVLPGSIVSRGHVATSSSAAASAWGNVYSVWPLDGASGLQTAYFRRSTTLWDPQYALPQGQGRLGPFFWRDDKQMEAFLKDNLVANAGLEAALSSEHEVVFASAPAASGGDGSAFSPYLCVPIFLEGRLFERLGITPFSSSVKPARAAPMDVDEVRRSSRDRFVVY